LFVRAVTQSRQMASALGVRTPKIDMLAFGLGSGIAGLAGCALSQIGNVGPDLGQGYIVDSFMVVVLGGVGQLAGTVTAAFAPGVVKTVTTTSWPELVQPASSTARTPARATAATRSGVARMERECIGASLVLVRAPSRVWEWCLQFAPVSTTQGSRGDVGSMWVEGMSRYRSGLGSSRGPRGLVPDKPGTKTE